MLEEPVAPTSPTPSEIKSAVEKAREQQEVLDDYTDEQFKRINLLHQWVVKNTDPTYLSTALSTAHRNGWNTLQGAVKALKEKFASSESHAKEQAIRDYRAALMLARTTSDKANWFKIYDAAYEEGRNYQIADLEGDSAIREFAEAGGRFQPSWAISLRNELDKPDHTITLDYALKNTPEARLVSTATVRTGSELITSALVALVTIPGRFTGASHSCML
ncbi:hypothetical protein MCOR33_011727 [Pyricularia grisea]|uniref:Uncharacterized protein n=1 Tax=Pyricularia grisea TaxID=148305 RepID=A0ABQ8N1T3_PYRGI|nr:hypothetical protein MCOR33_011727 [Pyricularia grisea]